ncbi:MAG: hypothetical protein HY955_07830 [Deltaproteobacteria bacterium]|nr:hypothetical protein [Deltaproteobacteria bacterium]
MSGGVRSIDDKTAEWITRRVLLEARNSVIAAIGAGEWMRLLMTEKAEICREATTGLSDMEAIKALLSDEADCRHL